MIRKLRSVLGLLLVATMMFSSTITAHAATATINALPAEIYQSDMVLLKANVSGTTWARLDVKTSSGTVIWYYEASVSGGVIQYNWQVPGNTTPGTYTVTVYEYLSGNPNPVAIASRSFTVRDIATNIDRVAYYWYKNHASGHTAGTNECGQVIQLSGGKYAVGTPMYKHGGPKDVIQPLLEGIGVSTTHVNNIRGIAVNSGPTLQGGTANTYNTYALFKRALDDYMSNKEVFTKVNISDTPKSTYSGVTFSVADRPEGLVHCHPLGSSFSEQDKYLAEYFNMPAYVVRNSGLIEKYTQNGSGTGSVTTLNTQSWAY